MTGHDEIDMTAAEYVLGTLDASDRARVETRRSSDPGLDAAITSWERRLAPLNDAVPFVEPSLGLYASIERRIELVGHTARIVKLERRLTLWRSAAIGASAIAAALMVAVGLTDRSALKQSQNFVAVFQKDDAQPAFLMSVDLATREVTIRAITADRKVGKAYQLWIVAEPFGPKPHSLGLLDDNLGPTRKRLSDLEPAVLQKAIFGISEEPPGGSPTGQPTGRALHGTLHQAMP